MPGIPTPPEPAGSAALLPQVIREVEEFAAGSGWDQPPQLFALVATEELLARQPELGEQLDVGSALTPVAQEPLPKADLAEALAGIVWPTTVAGCALVQEIVVLPPEAEIDLPADDLSPADGQQTAEDLAGAPDTERATRMRRIAAEHPRRREGRLVAGVLRDGSAACVLRLRGDEHQPDEIVEHPELAPNLVDALRDTLRE